MEGLFDPENPRFVAHLIYAVSALAVGGFGLLFFLMRGGVKGWQVLVMILGFFAVTIGVNVYFITRAVGTHPGEDVPRSYTQGLDYNDTLGRRAAQSDLGWRARVNAVDGRMVVAVEDAAGAPVRGLQLAGALRHRTVTREDCPLVFVEGENGIYRAPIECAGPGPWRMTAGHDGEPPFEFTFEVVL